MRTFTISKSQLEADYLELKSMLKIAKKYGVSKRLIMNRMNEFGIERRQPSFIRTADKVKPLILQGLSSSDIAIELSISITTVYEVANRYGLKTNNDYHKGFIVTHNGYKMIQVKNHPYCDSKGYVREHRLVMEQKLGRYLKPNEVVHHINHDKIDNRIDNLELTDLATHTREHHLGKKGRGKDLKPRKKQVKI